MQAVEIKFLRSIKGCYRRQKWLLFKYDFKNTSGKF